MLLNILFIYLLFLVSMNLFLLWKWRRMTRWRWGAIAVIWLPFFLLLIVGGVFWGGEVRRKNLIESYEAVFGGGRDEAYGNPREMLQGDEDTVCLYDSYDLSLVINKEGVPVVENLDPNDFPAEDGVWYAIFISNNFVTRVRVLSPGLLGDGCYGD